MSLVYKEWENNGKTNHSYKLDGKKLPGVTTLLGKSIPKGALMYWSAKSVAEWVIDNPDLLEQLRSMGRGPAIAALKEIPWQKRDTAATRGSEIHAIAEQVINGQTVQVPDHLADHVDGYVHWLDGMDVQPVLTEHAVASRRWGYGGKFDAIVRIGRGRWAGRQALLDWKTSSGVYGETGLQTAAYARADFYVPLDQPDTELPLPQIDCTGVVHVQPGESVLYPAAEDPPTIDRHFKLFTHAAFLAGQVNYISKELIGAPIEIEEGSA